MVLHSYRIQSLLTSFLRVPKRVYLFIFSEERELLNITYSHSGKTFCNEPSYVQQIRQSTCAEQVAAQKDLLNIPNATYLCIRCTSEGPKDCLPCACCAHHICKNMIFTRLDGTSYKIDKNFIGNVSYHVKTQAAKLGLLDYIM